MIDEVRKAAEVAVSSAIAELKGRQHDLQKFLEPLFTSVDDTEDSMHYCAHLRDIVEALFRRVRWGAEDAPESVRTGEMMDAASTASGNNKASEMRGMHGNTNVLCIYKKLPNSSSFSLLSRPASINP